MKAAKDLHGLIVGLGSIGYRHMQNLARRVGRLTVVRRRQSNAGFKPLDGVAVVNSVEEAITYDPDFAVICNPSNLHVETAQALLNSGIPSLIEKPLGNHQDPALNQFAESVAQSAVGQKCAMGYCMRYHPAYRTACQMVKSKAIGRCLYAKAWFEGYLPDWHPWEDHRHSYAARIESAGGALHTLDHEIDFLNWVLGPARFSTGVTVNSNAIEIDADDVAMITSVHGDNVNSQITLALCRKPPARGFEFIGDDGILRFTMESEKLTMQSRDGKIAKVAGFSPADINSMYVDMMEDYLNLITGGHQTTCSMASVSDGINALTVINDVTMGNRERHTSP